MTYDLMALISTGPREIVPKFTALIFDALFIKFRVQYVQNGYENCVHVDYHDDEQTAFPQAGTGNSLL